MSKIDVSNPEVALSIVIHNSLRAYPNYVGGRIHGPKKGGMGLVMTIIALVMLAASLAGAWAVYTYLLMVL